MGELNVQGDPSVPSALQSRIPEVLGESTKPTPLFWMMLPDGHTVLKSSKHTILLGLVLLGQQAEQALNKGDKGAIQCYSKAIELQL